MNKLLLLFILIFLLPILDSLLTYFYNTLKKDNEKFTLNYINNCPQGYLKSKNNCVQICRHCKTGVCNKGLCL